MPNRISSNFLSGDVHPKLPDDLRFLDPKFLSSFLTHWPLISKLDDMNGTAKHSIFLFQTDHITQLDLDRVERGFQDAESAIEFLKGTIIWECRSNDSQTHPKTSVDLHDYKRLDRLIRVVEAIVVW
jgi:hypothetical protein